MCVCFALPPTFVNLSARGENTVGEQTAMEMTGSERIAAPRDRVYRALNDPEVLQAAIPGCETIERLSDTTMTATVVTQAGPLKARSQGAVTHSQQDPTTGTTIHVKATTERPLVGHIRLR